MSKVFSLVTFCAALAVASSAFADEPTPAVAKPRLRIGVYDNRAIAIAHTASRFNPVKEKMNEHRKAKAAGDARKIRELEAWARRHQRRLHFQGFGRVPVTEMLKPVRREIAELAKKKSLIAITRECDYHGDNVEIVDVTDDLVALFAPSERTLKWVKSVKNAKPVDLIKLADLPADHGNKNKKGTKKD